MPPGTRDLSPIEQAFWNAYLEIRPPDLEGIVPQYCFKQYILDFAIPDIRIDIELDGWEFHSSKDKFSDDRLRDRRLTWNNWYVIRFSGRQVANDPGGCVRDAAFLVNRYMESWDRVYLAGRSESLDLGLQMLAEIVAGLNSGMTHDEMMEIRTKYLNMQYDRKGWGEAE